MTPASIRGGAHAAADGPAATGRAGAVTGSEPGLQFGVLGPLMIRTAAGSVILASALQRALLAALLLRASSEVTSTASLIDELWGEQPPATATKALQMHVSQLRRALGPDHPLITRPGGYAIAVERHALDLWRFEELVAVARARRAEADRAGAVDALRDALGLWRGEPLQDVMLCGEGAHEAHRLAGLRDAAQEECLELELELGHEAELIGELEALIARAPYRERAHGLLMRALYRAGRQSDALEAFRRARSLLVEDLGLEPGPELVRLEASILAQDPALRPDAVPRRAVVTTSSVPRATSSILGRDADLERALALLGRPDVRILSITGAGGIGKTRFALELADAVEDQAWFVELQSVASPDRVMSAIGTAIGRDAEDEHAVAAAFGQEPAVLFLDNFEHLVDAAPAVATLMRHAPALRVVVTSRAPLRIAGEHEIPLAPLPSEAGIELFVRRAREHHPGFAADPDERRCIAEICAHIDGLPLAIELAAARIGMLSAAEIAERLDDRLSLLTGRRRDAPKRHQTLRATIAWSHDLLDPSEQQLFAQLAVFPSGWSLDAGEAVAGRGWLDPLATLLDHGLVVRERDRFRMLETVREYALEMLTASSAASAIRSRHARWCLTLIETAEPELRGPGQALWFSRLDAERANLHSAGDWARDTDPELAMRLASAALPFWINRGAAHQARQLLEAALATGAGDEASRAKALQALGVCAGVTGDQVTAQTSLEHALEVLRRLGDKRQIARALMNLGVFTVDDRDYETRLARFQEGGAIWKELGDLGGQSLSLQNQAIMHTLNGSLEQALPLLEESVPLARAAQDGMLLASTQTDLASVLLRLRRSDPRIPTLLGEALALLQTSHSGTFLPQCLEAMAALRGRQGSAELAAALMGAADTERERAHNERTPEETPLFEATVAELVDVLGRDGYEHEHERGRADPSGAIEAALRADDRFSRDEGGGSFTP